MVEIGFVGAFVGGLLALVSPCAALLLPSFFAYAFDGAGMLLRRTGIFLLGLMAALVPLGAGVGALGATITTHRWVITLIGGLLLVALGVAVALGWGFALPGTRRLAGRRAGTRWVSVLTLGLVYGLAGVCSGPLLGGVLTLAIIGADPAYGALLMGVYAVGMTVPLLVLAAVWERFQLGQRSWLRGRPLRIGPVQTHTTSLVSGLFLVAIGVLFLATEGTANLGGMLGVDDQFDLQVTLGRWAAAVSDRVVLIGLLVALGSVGVWRLLRPPSQVPGAEDSTQRPL
jgi:cytochrome c biogenesis protein CcdA